MDEQTFMINRERAVDYLNSLDKVFESFPYFFYFLFFIFIFGQKIESFI
jgi:hypothetical protein